jgi:hypothetical protein
MKPITSDGMKLEPTDLILRSRAKHGVSKDGHGLGPPFVAVLRDARKSALLRTRLIDDMDMIRTSETLY